LRGLLSCLPSGRPAKLAVFANSFGFRLALGSSAKPAQCLGCWMNGFFVHGLVDWLLVEKVGQTPTDLPADISWLLLGAMAFSHLRGKQRFG
jgi:hypothetical protein